MNTKQMYPVGTIHYCSYWHSYDLVIGHKFPGAWTKNLVVVMCITPVNWEHYTSPDSHSFDVNDIGKIRWHCTAKDVRSNPPITELPESVYKFLLWADRKDIIDIINSVLNINKEDIS